MTLSVQKSFVVAVLGLLSSTAWSACRDLPTEVRVATQPIYVPRDAPIGSLIDYGVVNYDGTTRRTCADKLVVHEMLTGPRLASMPVATDPANGQPYGEHLYATGVPGVGLGVSHGSGKWCESPGVPYWGQILFPFTARSCSGATYETRVYYALYKTGPIEPGVHTLNQPAFRVVFDGAVQTSLTLAQTVTVAGCAMPDVADNQIEVALPATQVKDFSGPGTAGPPQLFSISMHSCVRGSYATSYPWNYFQGNYAHVRLDPARGSALIDASQGIVGLKPDSTAKGIGVQILKDDNSAMQLGTEVQIRHVEDGITQLPFFASYVQIDDDPPEGGSAHATVSFTVTFR
jgi:type 1 fimbria pilin